MFELDSFDDHESVHLFSDGETSLRAAIAIHSTVLGPSVGGCRVWNYRDTEAMLLDVLALSRAMSFKAAMADLPLGGGKMVVWRQDGQRMTPALLRALGDRVDQLAGRYWTAGDVGMSSSDLVHIRSATRYVAGLSQGRHASGDSAPATALGVYNSMRVAARRVLGVDSLEGVGIAVQGVGKVGSHLVRKLADDGARLVISNINTDRVGELASLSGAVVVDPQDIYDAQVEIFSPNAVGGTICEATVERLGARIIVGGANNQLSGSEVGDYLHSEGIVYCPDYVVNAGGVINLAGEVAGCYDPDRVSVRLAGIADTLERILERSQEQDVPPGRVADAMARERIVQARVTKADL